MPLHDFPYADPYAEGRMASMIVPKSVRPEIACPYNIDIRARAEWLQGFADECADGRVVFNLMLKGVR